MTDSNEISIRFNPDPMLYTVECDHDQYRLYPTGRGIQVDLKFLPDRGYGVVGEADSLADAILFALDDFDMIDAEIELQPIADT